MKRTAPAGSRLSRLAAGAVVVVGVVLPMIVGATHAGLLASVTTTVDSAASATMLYSHSYGTTCTSVPSGKIDDAVQNTACAGSLYPPVGGSRADAVTAAGTIPASRVTESVAVPTCGAAQLANDRSIAGPLLPRYGTAFQTGGPFGASSAVTLDGANPGGYASGAVLETAQSVSVFGASWGAAVWFKAPSTSTGGALFSLGTSSARDTTENFDRTLYLSAAGTLGFVYRTTTPTANGASITSSGTSYKDNAWHFAYARLSYSVLGVSAAVYVDGNQVATSSQLLSGLDGLTGYWHLGWAPARNGVPTQFFGGSLADFVVFNGGSAPASIATPTTQAQVDTFASTSGSAATGYWKLTDSGTTTVPSGTALPAIDTAAPCGYVDITWGSTNPTSCVVANQSPTSACSVTTTKLSTFAGSGFQQVGTVAAAATQTFTLTLAQDSSYAANASFLAGLIVYAPVSMRFAASAAWTQNFTWTTAGSVFVL